MRLVHRWLYLLCFVLLEVSCLLLLFEVFVTVDTSNYAASLQLPVSFHSGRLVVLPRFLSLVTVDCCSRMLKLSFVFVLFLLAERGLMVVLQW